MPAILKSEKGHTIVNDLETKESFNLKNMYTAILLEYIKHCQAFIAGTEPTKENLLFLREIMDFIHKQLQFIFDERHKK